MRHAYDGISNCGSRSTNRIVPENTNLLVDLKTSFIYLFSIKLAGAKILTQVTTCTFPYYPSALFVMYPVRIIRGFRWHLWAGIAI
jgi:hypothetical protein